MFTKAERAAVKKFGQVAGKLGGNARAKKLTARRRSEIARAAAKARWSKDRKSA